MQYLHQEHFYHDGHGFIEYRLKNLRFSQPEDKKLRKRRKLTVQQLQCDPSARAIDDVLTEKEKKEKVLISVVLINNYSMFTYLYFKIFNEKKYMLYSECDGM